MKANLLLAAMLLSAIQLYTQTARTMVVKTTGDTIYCDKIKPESKHIILETDGKKTKLRASEVSFYIEPYQYFVHDGDPPLMKDTTRKCFVSNDGNIHEVIIENEKYYLTYSVKKIKQQFGPIENYHIMSKTNEEVSLIPQNKTAPDTLSKYFGGACPEFDDGVKAEKKNFDKKIFPEVLWWNLLELYRKACMKKED